MASNDNALGETLAWLMKRAKLKNPDIADAAHVDVTTVSKWRSGVNRPDDAKLQLIVDLLASRGVRTSIMQLRHGIGADPALAPAWGDSRRVVRETPDLGPFRDPDALQAARVRVQELLLEFTHAGADDAFLAFARGFLVNPANYLPAAPDPDRLVHLERLAAVLRQLVADRRADGDAGDAGDQPRPALPKAPIKPIVTAEPSRQKKRRSR